MGVKRSHRDSVSSSEDPRTPYSREQSPTVKIVHLDMEPLSTTTPPVMRCSLPPHEPLTFSSFDDYDTHYQKMHVNRCRECLKNFPDERFLSLHITEYHDPIVAAKRDQGGKTYACLLTTCDRICSTPQNRRLHCIDKHKFPRDYDFIIVKDGIDKRSSMLRSHRRKSSAMGAGGEKGEPPASRRRGESSASAVVEDMDIVKLEDDQPADEEDGNNAKNKRYPTRLRGRGGFGHAGGRNDPGLRDSYSQISAEPTPEAKGSTFTDPMDSLTAGMSALQFIPYSVRTTQGTGRGRGG